MKAREVSKIINACRNKAKTKLDIEKVRALPAETKKAVGTFMVGHALRYPLLIEFANELDRSWLASMGYLYKTQSKVAPEFTFVHNGETKIR